MGSNPFTAEGYPTDEENRLALDRVKSISILRVPTAVKALMGTLTVFAVVVEVVETLLKCQKPPSQGRIPY